MSLLPSQCVLGIVRVMPNISANGIKVYYEEQGSGAPLVCISGLGAAHDSWALARNLLSRHFRVITFDNRGIGLVNAQDGPVSIGQMADDTVALIKGLGLSSAYIGNLAMEQ